MDDSHGHEAPLFPIQLVGPLPGRLEGVVRTLYDIEVSKELSSLVDPEKLTMVHFWASWCPPCVEELPEIVAFAKSNQAILKFVPISHDKSPENVQQFLADKPWRDEFQWYFDSDWSIERQLFGVAIPATAFVEPQGNLVCIHENQIYTPLVVGPRQWHDERYSVLVRDIASRRYHYEEIKDTGEALPIRFIFARQPMPAFNLVRLDGSPVDAAEFMGRVSIFHFWNPACSTSVETLTELATLVRSCGEFARLVPVIIAHVEEALPLTMQFISHYPWAHDLEWYVDSNGYDLWKKVWGSRHPGTVFTNPEGKIVTFEENGIMTHIISGARPWSDERYAKFLKDVFEDNNVLKAHSADHNH